MQRNEVEIGREVVYINPNGDLELGIMVGWFTKDMVNVKYAVQEAWGEPVPTLVSSLEYPSEALAKHLKKELAKHREEPKGLFIKYTVTKNDTGEGVDGCFVLRPDKDPAAIHAILAYADYCENVQGKTELAEDLRKWMTAVKVL